MLFFRIAVRNLLRHPVKTLLIGSLIAIVTGLLFCANAVFESTSRGLETSFVGSLTGDFAISALSDETIGIFGNEIPIVSEYESIEPLADYSTISERLNSEPSIQAWTPIVSTAAQVNIAGFVIKCPVFGIDASTYFAVCSNLAVESGDLSALDKGGVFLNAGLVTTAEKTIGRTLIVGEPVVFSMFTNGSFRARRGTFAGVYRYPAPTEAMNRIILADPVIVRSLCNYTMGYTLSNRTGVENTASVKHVQNMDDLFTDVTDTVLPPPSEFSLSELEATLSDTTERDTLVATDAAAWSFALVRVQPGKNVDAVRRNVAHDLTERQVEARVLDWRAAAGSSALTIFVVRSVFNMGIGVLILGATLMIMNALVISVLERTNEIGSMRALGAGRGFIRWLFVLETMIQTVVSAIVGITLGALVSMLLARRGIPLTNPLLITLFGGTSVHPLVEFHIILTHLGGSILIGSLAWIYPVSLALKIQPVSAMTER